MEKERNKIENICKAIIKERRHFIKFNNDIKNNIIHFNLDLISLINYFTSINFNKLNEYCWFGNFPKDEHIFYNYFNKYLKHKKPYIIFNEELKKHVGCNTIFNTKDNYNILLFILFSTDEEIYNKKFKHILKTSRIKLINKIFRIYTYEIFENYTNYNIYNHDIMNEFYNIYLKLLFKNTKFYNMSFQGNFFFNFKNMIYYIIFNNYYNNEKKSLFLIILQTFLNDLLESINYISFLPLNILSNNKYCLNEIDSLTYSNKMICRIRLYHIHPRYNGYEIEYYY